MVTRAHQPGLLCTATGTEWLQRRPRAQVGEVGVGEAEFKADMAILGARPQARLGSSLDTAHGLGLRPSTRLSHSLPHHAAAFPAARP